jgi:hypothetical protein
MMNANTTCNPSPPTLVVTFAIWMGDYAMHENVGFDSLSCAHDVCHMLRMGSEMDRDGLVPPGWDMHKRSYRLRLSTPDITVIAAAPNPPPSEGKENA